MTRQQAIDFIAAVNSAQPFVPPIVFGGIANSDVAKLAIMVANGSTVCEVHSASGVPVNDQPAKSNGVDAVR